jgi:hypothetical protein
MSLADNVDRLVAAINAEGIFSRDMKSVTAVGRITTLAQSLFPEEKDKDFLKIVQNGYITAIMVARGFDQNQARQSWVAASGGDFEGYIRNHVNQALNAHGIVAIKGDRLRQLQKRSENVRQLIAFLTLPAKRRCTQTSVAVWPDNDVLILAKTTDERWRMLASVSAKTSSHSRNTSVLFWALAVRDLGVKYFLVTQDRDNQYVKPCASPSVNQERRLFEAYCDRVFTSNPRASYCAQVKSLILRDDGTSELTDELLDIKMRDVPNAVDGQVSLAELESY